MSRMQDLELQMIAADAGNLAALEEEPTADEKLQFYRNKLREILQIVDAQLPFQKQDHAEIRRLNSLLKQQTELHQLDKDSFIRESERLEQHIQDARKEAQDTRQENAQIAQQVDTLMGRVDGCNTRFEEFKTSSETRAQACIMHIAELKDKLEEAEATSKDLEAQNSDLQAAVAAAEENIKDVQEAARVAHQRKQDAEKKAAKALRQLEELRSTSQETGASSTPSRSWFGGLRRFSARPSTAPAVRTVPEEVYEGVQPSSPEEQPATESQSPHKTDASLKEEREEEAEEEQAASAQAEPELSARLEPEVSAQAGQASSVKAEEAMSAQALGSQAADPSVHERPEEQEDRTSEPALQPERPGSRAGEGGPHEDAQVEEQPASQETAALVPMPKSDAAENSPGHAPKEEQHADPEAAEMPRTRRQPARAKKSRVIKSSEELHALPELPKRKAPSRSRKASSKRAREEPAPATSVDQEAAEVADTTEFTDAPAPKRAARASTKAASTKAASTKAASAKAASARAGGKRAVSTRTRSRAKAVEADAVTSPQKEEDSGEAEGPLEAQAKPKARRGRPSGKSTVSKPAAPTRSQPRRQTRSQKDL